MTFKFDGNGLKFNRTWVDRIMGKVDKDQGVANAGKVLGIGNDGRVTPVEQSGGGSGGYTEYALANLSSDPTIIDKLVPGTIITTKVPMNVLYFYPYPTAFITVNDMKMVTALGLGQRQISQVASGIITGVNKKVDSTYTHYIFNITNGLITGGNYENQTVNGTQISFMTQLEAIFNLSIRITNGALDAGYSYAGYVDRGRCCIKTEGFVETTHMSGTLSSNTIPINELYALVPN